MNSISININIPLPPPQIRGMTFRNDRYFWNSSQAEADRLVKHFNVTHNSSVLDIGCGVGRLPIGILNRIRKIQYYCGIDVNKKAIQWCQNNITILNPNFKFILIDAKNLRYTPNGKEISFNFQFPLNNKKFDLIYLYSVFSHMTVEDVKIYLREFQRLLEPSGKIFLTGFFEDGVPNMTINPQGYKKRWQGHLHCVRYSKHFFELLLTEYGFYVDQFDYGKETDGQSALYISRGWENDISFLNSN